MKTMIASAVLMASLTATTPRENLASQEKPPSHDKSSCPLHEQHKAKEQDAHQQSVIERGAHVMGFSHDKATHHFLLYQDGGAIDVQANQPEDAATRDAIRSHFTHIVKMFAEGDFSAPMLIHSQNPPGTEALKQLRGQIQYKLESTSSGARIRITSKNAEAVQAVHTFLRFQIEDHHTGDDAEAATAH